MLYILLCIENKIDTSNKNDALINISITKSTRYRIFNNIFIFSEQNQDLSYLVYIYYQKNIFICWLMLLDQYDDNIADFAYFSLNSLY